MPTKRSRAGDSTSHLGNSVVTVRSSVVFPRKIMRIDAAVEASPPQRRIFAIGSPVKFLGSNHRKIGGFLERCYYCKKRLDRNSEVYMYSNLCAFCTPECRAYQISQDLSAAKHARYLKERSMQRQGNTTTDPLCA